MRKGYFTLLLTLFAFSFTSALAASNLEEGVGQLAQQISKSMEEKQKQKIAITDFSDLNGNVTALGQFMAEELTTQLFMVAPGKFEVVERRQLLKLEEELMLGQTGFIEEKSIKKMGQVLGVDAIVTGSMTDLGNTVKINARLIGVESAKVFAVAATDIPKTGMVADLIGKQVEKKPGVIQAATTNGSSGKQEARAEGLQKVEAQDFVFELQSCKISGENISCSLLITNKGSDSQIEFARSVGNNLTRIFDDAGNEYQVANSQLANQPNSSGWGVRKLLVSGIPAKASLKFEKVSQDATNIALLEIDCSSKKNDFKVQFRNIPLSK